MQIQSPNNFGLDVEASEPSGKIVNVAFYFRAF